MDKKSMVVRGMSVKELTVLYRSTSTKQFRRLCARKGVDLEGTSDLRAVKVAEIIRALGPWEVSIDLDP